jgi:chromosome segregation ATPase
VKEKEARVGELEEALEQASSDTETKAGPSAAAAEEPGRIEALGAKAVAEFKLGQLNARLSAVTKEMEAKTAQLETVRKSAEEKAARLDRLTAETQQLRASEQARTQELSEKVAQLQEDLSKRISDEANLKRELDEKTAMLGALRQAVVDAGRIKTSAEKETVETQKGAEKLSKELEIAKSHLAGLNEELESCRVNFDSREAELNRLNSELRAAFMREQALYADVDRFRHESQALQSRPASVAPQESAARKESEPTSLDRILGASGQKEVGASLY